MKGNYLRITDDVQFSLLGNGQDLIRIKDDYQGNFATSPNKNVEDFHNQQTQGKALQVSIAATHSGIITRNNGFYLPEKMKEGTKSWLQDYGKPILLHHKDHDDNIGRVIGATYQDTSGSVIKKFDGLSVRNSAGKTIGTVNSALIKDFCNGGMPYGQQVDVVRSILRDTLLEDNGYEGLGYIKLVANIADPTAIQKLLDGRYLTGSVGATTNKAVCSVCRTDWTEGGPCEHKPGAIYDSAKCFIIAGALSYDEYSFVNVPADRHSGVLQLHYNGITDNVEIANENGRIYEVQLGFPQYDSVTKEEEGMTQKNTKKVEETTETNLEIKDSTTPAPDAEQMTDGAQENVTDSATSATEESTDETIVNVQDASDNGDESTNKTDIKDTTESDEDFLTRIFDSKESLSDEDDERAYSMLWNEVEDLFKGDTVILEALGVEKLEDAKLSAERRKSLTKSQFCGPNRSFPVPDCAHVTAAKRLLNRAKLSEAAKADVLSCVNRKSKAMGCSDNSNKSDSVKTQDNMNHARMLRGLLSVLEEDHYYSNESVLDEDEKGMLQAAIKRLAGLVGKDSFINAVVSSEIMRNEEALLDEIVKHEETIGDLRERLDATQKEYHLLFEDMSNLQDALVEEKASSRKIKESHLSTLITLKDSSVTEHDFTSLSDSELDLKVKDTNESIDMVKITDKLGDGMSRIPSESVEDPNKIQDNKNQNNKVNVATLQKIEEHYMYLKLRPGGAEAAEQYLADMKRQGFLPQESENLGGTN